MENRKKHRKTRIIIKIIFFLIIAIILLTKIINEEKMKSSDIDFMPELNSSNTTINTEPSLWSNDKISVSIATKVQTGNYKMQYSLDNGKTWYTYTKPFEVEDNGTTIQVRLWDGKKDSGHVTGNVTNIDRLKPTIVSVDETHTTNSITISAEAIDEDATEKDAKSGIGNYYFSIDNGNTWFPEDGQIGDTYTFENLDPTKDYEIKVKVKDNAGNETESESITVNLLDKPSELNPNNTKIIVTPPKWTNSAVKVEIETIVDTKNCQIQYSIDKNNWINYSTPFYVNDNNTKIYVRLFNGKYSGECAIGEITNIDRLPPDKVDFNETHTTNNITLTAEATDSAETEKDGKSDINKYYFSIDNGKTWFPKDGQQEKTYTFKNLNQNQDYNLKVRAIDNAGNQRESESKVIKTNKVSDLNKSNTEINITPSSWTNKSVKVEILSKIENENNIKLQYSNDAVNWNDYTGTFNQSDNGTIYARLWDGVNEGGYATANIKNIDRLSPNINSVSETHSTNNIIITVDAEDAKETQKDGKSGIEKYFFSNNDGMTYFPTEGQSENTYKFENLLHQKEYKIKVKVIDIAGNEKESETKIIKTDKLKDLNKSNTQINAIPSTWTNENVKVEISTNLYSKDNKEIKLQYSFNGYDWNNYQEPITIKNNTVIYSRLFDGINKGEYATANITNIDRLAPDQIVINETHTSNSIELSIDADDSEATQQDGKSGIDKYYFSIDNGETYFPKEGQAKNTYVFNSLNQERDYKVKVKVVDKAGNYKESSTKLITTDKVLGLTNENAEIKINPETWTNNDVEVEIITSEYSSNYTLQFSTNDGATWLDYSGPFNISNDKVTIYARLFDGINEGKNISRKITNIDRLNPKEVEIESYSAKSNSITITAHAEDEEENEINGKSDIAKYFFSKDDGMSYFPEDGQESKTFTFENLEQNKEYNIKIKAIDKAGNEKTSETETIKTLLLEDLKESNTKITVTPSTWTNKKVSISIETTVDLEGKTLQYSKDALSWIEYKEPFEVEDNNETIYVRIFDGTNESGYATTNITNIDRLNPDKIEFIETHSTNSITILAEAEDHEATETDGKSEIEKYYFSIDDGENWTDASNSNTYIFEKLLHNKTYNVKVKVEDRAGNYKISDSKNVTTGTVTDLNSENTNIIIEPEEWTNKVTVTIENNFDLKGTKLEYSTNKIDWHNYEQSFEITDNNTTIYARLSDGVNNGEYISKEIKNIDKLNPIISDVEEQHKTNSITINVNAKDHEETGTDGKSEIEKYYFSINGGNTWVPSEGQDSSTYTFYDLEQNHEYEIVVRVKDYAGNYTDSVEKVVKTNIVPILNENNTTINVTPSKTWTNTSVIASISTTEDTNEYTLQYSTNALDWNDYIKELEITDNCTIYARLWDGNNGGQFIEKEIKNIDKLKPIISKQEEIYTTNSITVVVVAEDHEETKTDGKSEIKKYYFSNNNGETWLPEEGQDNGTYTFNNLEQNSSFEILVKIEDNAGNCTFSETKTVTTKEVPGGESIIKFIYSISEWTNQNVDVYIVHTAGDEYTLQYLNGNEWVEYTDAIEMTENGSITARLADKTNQVGATSTGNVANIDKNDPTPGNLKMTLNEISGSEYTEKTWTNQSVYLALEEGQDDESGIESTTFKIEGQVTVTNRSEDYTITESGIYTATLTTTDKAGNFTINNYTIKIDKDKPTSFTPTLNPQPTQITITAKTNDGGTLDENSKSGVKKYYFSIYKDGKWSAEVAKDATDNGASNTFTGLTRETSYKIKVIAEDDAKNRTEKEVQVSTTIETYTIQYDINGGTGKAPANQTKKYGATIKITTEIPVRTGYVFQGWATTKQKADAGTIEYASGANYSNNSNLTLYAVWKKPVPTTKKLDTWSGGGGGYSETYVTDGGTITFSGSYMVDTHGSASGGYSIQASNDNSSWVTLSSGSRSANKNSNNGVEGGSVGGSFSGYKYYRIYYYLSVGDRGDYTGFHIGVTISYNSI